MAPSDGTTPITIRVLGLRFPASTTVTFSTTVAGIAFTPAQATLDADGVATTTFTAPATPMDVVVDVRAADGTAAQTVVEFTSVDAPPDIRIYRAG